MSKLLEDEKPNDAEKAFIDLNLVAECHIMFEALTAVLADFNAAKDNILLSFRDQEPEKRELAISKALEFIIAASEHSHDV